MAEEYRTVIGAKLNGRLCYFDLDTCMSKSLNSNATVAQYPVEKGDTVSDHMYRNARSLNLSGSFSLAGRNSYEKNNLYTKDNIIGELEGGNKSWEKWFEEDAGELKDLSSSNRLESIQKVFEYIQAKGILCTVMMCSGKPGDNNTRFKVRDNMALTGITWREAYNSMAYDFTFTEIISVTRDLNFETFDYSDLYPQVYLPATKSLGQIMNDTGSLVQMIIEALFDWGYIDWADGKAYVLKGAKTEWSAKIYETCADIVARNIGIGAIAGVAIGATVGWIVAGSSAGGPVGLAVGLCIAAAFLAIAGIVTIVQTGIKEHRLNQGFNLIKNYAQYVDPKTYEPRGNIDTALVNEVDLVRLRQLLEDVQYAVDSQMSKIGFYTITDDETDNSGRDVPIQVGVDALTVRINATGDSTNPFKIQLLKGYGEGAEPVSPLFGGWPAADSLYNMSSVTNILYKDSSRQYELYLFNPYLTEEMAKAAGYNSVAEAASRLSNYYFVVSQGNMKDNMDNLSKIISKALADQGYTE